MISRRAFAVLAVLAGTVGAVAGVAVGLVAAVSADRLRSLLEPIEWEYDE